MPITYSYVNLLDGSLPSSSQVAELKAAVEEALSLWASVTPLVFEEVTDPEPGTTPPHAFYPAAGYPMIRIGHHPMEGELAHAPYPSTTDGLGGDVHYDDSDRIWNVNRDVDSDFLAVTAHEVGHALGLAHAEGQSTRRVTAVMSTFWYAHRAYNGLGTAFLYEDDINGIREVYGNLGTGTGYVRTKDGRLIVRGHTDADTISASVSGNDMTLTANGFVHSIPIVHSNPDVSALSLIQVYGRDGDDTVTFDSTVTTPAEIRGGAGNDTLTGGSGNDTLEGGPGDDTLKGAIGGDAYVWSGSSNLGSDIVHEYGANTGARDLLDFSAFASAVQFNMDSISAQVVSPLLTLAFTAFSRIRVEDLITSQVGSYNDYITGNSLGNTIETGGGDDTIIGGDGNDDLNGRDGNDAVYGGIGNDTVRGGFGADDIYGDEGDDILIHTNDFNDIILFDGSDILHGGAGDDSHYYRMGEDTVVDP